MESGGFRGNSPFEVRGVQYKCPVLVEGITPSVYSPLHAILAKPKASSIYAADFSSSYTNY